MPAVGQGEGGRGGDSIDIEGFVGDGLTANLKSSRVLKLASLFLSSKSTVNVLLP